MCAVSASSPLRVGTHGVQAGSCVRRGCRTSAAGSATSGTRWRAGSDDTDVSSPPLLHLGSKLGECARAVGTRADVGRGWGRGRERRRGGRGLGRGRGTRRRRVSAVSGASPPRFGAPWPRGAVEPGAVVVRGWREAGDEGSASDGGEDEVGDEVEGGSDDARAPSPRPLHLVSGLRGHAGLLSSAGSLYDTGMARGRATTCPLANDIP